MTQATELAALGLAPRDALLRARCLIAAAEFELADKLSEGPLSVEEIAERAKVDANSLFRLMRALESIGFFRQKSPRVFENTTASDALRRDVERSQWASLRMFAPGGVQWEGLSRLTETVRTGRSGREDDPWERFRRNPEERAIMDEGMRALSRTVTPAVTAAFNWSGFPIIADIGGGIGTQLVDILDTQPTAQGILFELPEAAESAIKHERIEFRAGSFLKTIPVSADAYILRWVLMDFQDHRAIQVLKHIRNAAPSHSRVMVIEPVIPETAEYHSGKFSDIMMMVGPGGRCRTRPEFESLFHAAGFELEEVHPTESPVSIVVARPKA